MKNQNVLVLGFARSGYSIAKVLVNLGANVLVNDMALEHDQKLVDELEALGVQFIFGSHPMDLVHENLDLIVKNPGIPRNHQYEIKALELDIEVTTEIDLAYKLMADAKFIAITGSNGKTTSASLVYDILKANDLNVYLAGNIGDALSNYYDKATKDAIFVVEISAQQLLLSKYFHPNIAAITNIKEAHLDYFGGMDLYTSSKLKIFDFMDFSDIAIINADDEFLLENTYDLKPEKLYFSTDKKVHGAYYDDHALYLHNIKFMDTDEIKLVGMHNYSNILMALLIVENFEIDFEKTKQAIRNFGGVAHRLEFVRDVDNIAVYNDSKSTNVDATIVALASFTSPVVLLLGGLERGQDFVPLLTHMNYVKSVVAFGECRTRIVDLMNDYSIEVKEFDDFSQAVLYSLNIAQPFDTVLFSPACASWDSFKNFEERGNFFKILVNQI